MNTSTPPNVNTDAHISTQHSPAQENKSQEPQGREEADATNNDQSSGFWASLATGLSAYRSRLMSGSDKPAKKPFNPAARPTDEELQKKYAGQTPEHVRRIEPGTGYIVDQWLVHGKDENGKFTTTYRSDGPAEIVTDPKTGMILEESYHGAHGPNGREYLERDAKTGVVTEEHLRGKDGSFTTIMRDETTGVVTYQDKLNKDGKLVECVDRDPGGTPTGLKGKNRDGQTVGAPGEMASDQTPQKAGSFKGAGPVTRSQSLGFLP
jgi:hypothetical protein